MKNDSEIIIRIPKEVKEKFLKQCDEEFIGMSVKIRQLIIKDIKKQNGKKNMHKV